MKGKLIQKLCAVSLSVLMLTGAGVAEIGSFMGTSLPVSASSSSDFSYRELDDGTIEIAYYTGDETTVTIPGRIGDHVVTKVSCDIPGGVKIIVPDSVNAFYYSNLPGTLQNITVSSSNPTFSTVDGVLYNKDKTKVLFCPRGKSGEIRLEDSVTDIENRAFFGCERITKVTMPDGLNSVGEEAFSYCNSLTSAVLPQSVTTVGARAFRYCSGLTSAVFPQSVTSIGADVFENCSGLTSAQILCEPNYISFGLFAGCTNLKTVNIPDSVKRLFSGAFYNCQSLKKVTLPNGLTEMDDSVFANCSSLTEINLPASLTRIDSTVFMNCKSLKKVVIPEGVAFLKFKTFSGCTSLEEVVLPASLQCFYGNDCAPTEEDGVFSQCESLTSLTIPEGTRWLPFAFCYGCTRLERVYIPDSVESIVSNAFGECPNLVIYGNKGSYAETFAHENSIPFVSPIENTSSVSSRNIVKGGSVTVNCASDCGSGKFQYAVFYKQKTQTKWTCAQSFKANKTVKITPKAATSYTIRVKAKDTVTGKVVNKDFTVKVNAPLKNTSAISAQTVTKGSSVTVNCASEGGLGTSQYAVYYKQQSQTKWTCAQNYKTNKTVKITPKAATTYNIRVKAKDASGKIVNKDFTLTVTAVSPLKNTSTVTPHTGVTGRTVIVNCKAEGGQGGYQYAVFYKRTTQTKWTCVQSYSSNQTVSITPQTVSTYTIRVKVKDASGKIVNKDFYSTVP